MAKWDAPAAGTAKPRMRVSGACADDKLCQTPAAVGDETANAEKTNAQECKVTSEKSVFNG